MAAAGPSPFSPGTTQRLPAFCGGNRQGYKYEAHYEPPVWPSAAGKQHITEHLDTAVKDLDETVTWAVGAGATLAEYQPQEDVRVMLDPAGHPFCLALRTG